MAGQKITGTDQQFDPEFRFLLALDPTFEEWRALASEWWPLERRSSPVKNGLTGFFGALANHGDTGCGRFSLSAALTL